MFEAMLHALAAAAASFLAVPLAVRMLARHQVIDTPNERSSHSRPVPRGGGIGLLLPFAFGTAVLLAGPLRGDAFAGALLVGVLGMAVIGFIDDLRTLPALPRLVAEGLLAALCLAWADAGLQALALPGLGSLELGAAGPVVTWLFVVGFTNMFNFMDGINGLAGFQTLLGAGGLALLGAQGGDAALALPLALLAGGAVGFLRSNFPRAAVFMGDVGSLPIGFALAMGVLRAHGHGGLPVWIPALMIWPFLLDATYTLVNRTLRGRNPFRAHRTHVYQRLTVLGWSHTRVTTVYAAAMLVCVVAADGAAHGGWNGIAVFWPIFAVTLVGSVLTVIRVRASRLGSAG